MKRLWIVLLGLLALDFGVAVAVPGPEVEESRFVEIVVREIGGPTYDVTQFLTADGWDFGDRHAYACAWIEFFQDDTELFEIHYELVIDYPIPTQVNDTNGNESPDNDIVPLCGDGLFGASQVWDGSDHHPHGTQFDFFYKGQQVASVDYSLQDPNGCDQGYWTPGDEPGEAWLWWDPDGPEESVPGVPLNCGGGPGEPFVVLRAWVQNAAPGVGYCTEDSMDGDWCTGVSSTVTLRLEGSIRATGFVRSPDGPAECVRDRVVVIERRALGDWKRVGKDRTSDTGRYSLHIRDRNGVYRARAMKVTLAGGDTCEAATSKRRFFQV